MKIIRAAALAKHIGISSQELRQMLSEVNFGIKPTDRELPISFAAGIIRFAGRKFKREIPPLEAVPEEVLEDEKEEKQEQEDLLKKVVASQIEARRARRESAAPQAKAKKPEPVSEEIKPKKPEEPRKENAFDRLNKLGKKKAEVPVAVRPPSAPAIFRKIEVDPQKTAAAKKKIEEKEQKSKEEREQVVIEKKAKHRKKKTQVFVKKEGVVGIPANISVKEFSEKVGISPSAIFSVLLKNGVMVTLTQSLDFDTFALVAEDLEVQIKKEEAEASIEDIRAQNITQLLADERENLVERPPVVVVMGHVDHGKTAILDAIRDTKVVEGEAGGITQHIGAYQVEKKGKKLTFLDTPGHEAFTAMRARGSKTADIAILVVAADEGMKPQTIEALNHARAGDLPIIVAINKIDKPDANLDRIKGQLAEHDLTPEDWGGKTVCVPVSALQRKGIDELLEIIVLQSELLELKANPNRLGVATVVEAHLDSALGPVATIIVNAGTLRVADDFVLGEEAGRIKMLVNDFGKKIVSAEPGKPVQIAGMPVVPPTGAILQVFPNKKTAQEKAEQIRDLSAAEKKSGVGLSEIMAGLSAGKMKFLKIVLKADTEGSLEAVRQSLEKIDSAEVRPKIIHGGVGGVTETDVMMAAASEGIVIGFNALVSPRVKRISEKEGVEVQNYDIIYNLIDDVKKILTGLLEPEILEITVGELFAKKIFYTKKKMMIVGCEIKKGFAELGASVKIFRGEEQEKPVGIGKIAVLQHFERKLDRLEEGNECGIQFEGKVEILEGDRLELWKSEKRMKTL